MHGKQLDNILFKVHVHRKIQLYKNIFLFERTLEIIYTNYLQLFHILLRS